jgi:Tropinone reductase 1
MVSSLSIVYGKLTWNLEGKNAVVTGGTKGIGKSIVEELSELGCTNIITCSRTEEDLAEAQREWESRGYRNIKTIVADVSTASGRENLFSFCKQEFGGKGGLHCLVNNVGSNIRKPAIEYSSEEYEKIMRTNLDSCVFTSLGLYNLLAEAADSGNAGASVVNVGSVAGGCGSSMRSGCIYAMTKAAMTQLSYNLGCEWATRKIRINTVSPWYIATPLAEQVLKDPEYLKKVLSHTPMKRVGRVEEVAAAVSFLLMDVASFITGQNIPVDGGFLRSGFY